MFYKIIDSRELFSRFFLFFKNTLPGNLFYATVFFGAYEITEVWIRNSMGVDPVEKFQLASRYKIFFQKIIVEIFLRG